MTKTFLQPNLGKFLAYVVYWQMKGLYLDTVRPHGSSESFVFVPQRAFTHEEILILATKHKEGARWTLSADTGLNFRRRVGLLFNEDLVEEAQEELNLLRR